MLHILLHVANLVACSWHQELVIGWEQVRKCPNKHHVSKFSTTWIFLKRASYHISMTTGYVHGFFKKNLGCTHKFKSFCVDAYIWTILLMFANILEKDKGYEVWFLNNISSVAVREKLPQAVTGDILSLLFTVASRRRVLKLCCNLKAEIPKLFKLAAPLTLWAIGCCSPLALQSYSLYRVAGFSWGFNGSLGNHSSQFESHCLTIWHQRSKPYA